MKGRFLPIILVAVIVSLLGGVAFAQLSSVQRASGSINVTSSASADLYICEPNSTQGPDCGADDSGADELVFETVEDMLPGDVIQRYGGEFVLAELKTEKSRRTIRLPDICATALRSHQVRQRTERERIGAAWSNSWDLVSSIH